MASKKQKSKKVGKTKIKAAAAPKSIKKHARGGKGNKNKPKASVTPKTRRSARLAFAAEEVVHPVSQKKIEAKITKAQPFRSIFDIKLPAPAVSTIPVKDPIKSAAVKRSHKQPAKITKPVQNKKPNVERESRKLSQRRKQKLALVNDTDPRGLPKCISRTPMPASPDGKRLTKPRSWDAAFKSLGWYHPKDNYTFYPVPEGYSLTLRRPFGISGTELEQWHEDAENGPLAGLAIAVRAYGPEKRKYRLIQKPRTLPKFGESSRTIPKSGESSRTIPKSGEPSETLPKFSEPKFGEPRFGEPSTIWPTKKIQTRSQTSPLPFTRSKRRTASAMNSPSERFYTIRKYSDAGDISPE
ncbi:hypothetical protein D6D15_07454 [Aureobasidium pullulans]|uniref:Uncharacterized protein n=1 Tax=Aureobasidium pullulans TaxID=5580 RepID=A0A4S9B118_AURPU|nr:hypothetical protein D6D15_07454 [Aureobasidium pullulans]